MKLSFDTAWNKPDRLDSYNEEQIKALRHEAEQVKSCFTTFSFQTIALATAMTALAANFSHELQARPILAWLAAALVLLLATITARIGTYKYGTANRTTGYQIHLSRCIDYMEAAKQGATQQGTAVDFTADDHRRLEVALRRMDWEEAMFAWRVVQPVIFGIFHGDVKWILGLLEGTKPGYSPDKSTKPSYSADEARRPRAGYTWNDTKQLLRNDDADFRKTIRRDDPKEVKEARARANFYPGSYLRRMAGALFLIASTAALGMLAVVAVSIASRPHDAWWAVFASISGAAITLLAIAMAFCQWLVVFKRTKILESGLTSIQTCAFVWRIVCLAHLLALEDPSLREDAQKDLRQPYKGYTGRLARVAVEQIAFKLDDVHEWIKRSEDNLMEVLREKYP